MRRKDEKAYITLERTDGADGDISCIVNTKPYESKELLGGRI